MQKFQVGDRVRVKRVQGILSQTPEERRVGVVKAVHGDAIVVRRDGQKQNNRYHRQYLELEAQAAIYECPSCPTEFSRPGQCDTLGCGRTLIRRGVRS